MNTTDNKPKSAEDWNWEYINICGNDPAVHGQLLPSPKNISFIRKVQADAINGAIRIADTFALNHKLSAQEVIIAIQIRDAIEKLVKDIEE